MAQKPDDLVGVAEVAAMLNISRTQANRWTKRPDFPEPLARLRATPVWRAGDVKAWAEQEKPQPVSRSGGLAGYLARRGAPRRKR
jgi:predicted DNA-binding transcriptional regulator AlpA